MPKLFHLSCSPRADSESSAGARVFIDRFRQARPDWDIDVMNLWRDHMPEFEGYVLEAKYARIGGRAFTDSQRDAFAVTERIALRFALADRVLISTPMWNFGIPYKLKQWIDVITQPGLAFRFDPAQGYLPLFKDRPTVVIWRRQRFHTG
jgi:FMN-dependent NADH-azoreductase